MLRIAEVTPYGAHYRAFYTATGYMAMIGEGLLVIWFLVASVSMTVKRGSVAATRAN